jgi:serine/threonine-protein kinase HipA
VKLYVYAYNDMHLKNFSMYLTDTEWNLSPAYDLLNISIVIPNDTEETALTLSRKKSNFTKPHFIEQGESIGLTKKQIGRSFERIKENYHLSLSG